MPFVLLLLLVGTSFAQLPEGFAPPRELLHGPLAEGSVSEFLPPEAVGRANSSHFVSLQSAIRDLPQLDSTAAYNLLRSNAERVVGDPKLVGRLSLFRNTMARALLLVEDLAKETDLTQANGKEVATAILLGAFRFNHDNRELNDWILAHGVNYETIDQLAVAYPYAASSQDFARRMFAAIPLAESSASRLRLVRRLVEFLVWDLSRDTTTSQSHQNHILAATQLLREIEATPFRDPHGNEVRLERLKQLSILPLIEMREEISFFSYVGRDQNSRRRLQAWSHFQSFFAEAAQCGMVTCATTDGRGTFVTISHERDGAIQERVVDLCMRSPVANSGPVCREALYCSMLQEVPATRCPDRTRAAYYYESGNNYVAFPQTVPWGR